MSQVFILIIAIPGAYFTAVLAMAVLHLALQAGSTTSTGQRFALLRPLVRGLVFFLLPGMIVSNVMTAAYGIQGPVALAPALIGATLSGLFIHRSLILTAQQPRKWSLAIAAVAVLLLAVIGIGLFGAA